MCVFCRQSCFDVWCHLVLLRKAQEYNVSGRSHIVTITTAPCHPFFPVRASSFTAHTIAFVIPTGANLRSHPPPEIIYVQNNAYRLLLVSLVLVLISTAYNKQKDWSHARGATEVSELLTSGAQHPTGNKTINTSISQPDQRIHALIRTQICSKIDILPDGAILAELNWAQIFGTKSAAAVTWLKRYYMYYTRTY